MKLIQKSQFGKKLQWIKDRDINGNWGYRNINTGQFRATIPNSAEEKQQEQVKRNRAVVKQYSANKAKFDRTESKLRNHGDESIKLHTRTPIITSDSKGNLSTSYSEPQLAPNEDSTQIDTTLEGLLVGDKLFKLGVGLGKLALTKTGQNAAAHWARNSLLNREISSLNLGASSTPLVSKNIQAITEDTPNSNFSFLTKNPSKAPLVSNKEMEDIMHQIKLNADRNITAWENFEFAPGVRQYAQKGYDTTGNSQIQKLGKEYVDTQNMKAPHVSTFDDFPADHEFRNNLYYNNYGGVYTPDIPNNIYLNEAYFSKYPKNKLSTALHEIEHMYQYNIHKYTPQQKEFLNGIYIAPDGDVSGAADILEKGATNKEYQGIIYNMAKKKLNKDRLSLEELNDYIDNLSDNDLLNVFKMRPNGYATVYQRNYERLPDNILPVWVKGFRHVLKYMPGVAPIVSNAVNNNQESKFNNE